jgi:arsenate reductase
MKWLADEGIPARFHDFRAEGLAAKDLDAWIDACGWEGVLNRKGTTWKKLPASDTANLDKLRARALMLQHPTLIKRPVFDLGQSGVNAIVIGFKEPEQEKIRAALS